MKRYADKGDYMPVDKCPTINIVTAVIDFYKRQPEPFRLKTIALNPTHWRMFVEEMKHIDDTYEPNAVLGVPIEGSDVSVKRGSSLQVKELVYEFYQPVNVGIA